MTSNLFNVDYNLYNNTYDCYFPLNKLSLQIIKYINTIKNDAVNLNKFHNVYRNLYISISNKYNYNSKKEYYIKDIPELKGRRGFIDVIWYNDYKYIAIEIDSCARTKSIMKLLNSNIDIKLWIIYGNKKCKQRLYELDKNYEIIYIDLGNLKKHVKDNIKKLKD